MKKTLGIISILLVTVLLTAACSKVIEDEPMTESKADTMADEDEADDMMVDDGMADDSMVDDTMTDEHDGDDTMADDTMDKDDNMTDDPMMTNEGEAAPGFELMDTDGNTHSLADYAGKKVYVKVWAS
ncbi:MAG: hypothetical protein PF505_12815, partial [Vallitaleaceae bacterium]|nr:hypothetical protein [Vallitaleaceae bacterium]